MVSFMNHEVFESVDLSVSQGNGPQDSECSDMGLGQSMTTSRLLQPTMPSGEPSNVNEKQYKPIQCPRRRRAGAKARGENGPLKVKKPRARDYYGRFLAKNGTGEGSVPRGGPPRDGRGRFVAMKGGRRGVGGDSTCANQYESIVNLQAPDFTTLLGIMDGGRHGIKGSKHYRNIARLQDPGFASVLNAMNNISYKAVDDGPYDVLKVLLQADGGMAGW